MSDPSPSTRGQSAFWLMYLFDIAEAAKLDVARSIAGAEVAPEPFPSPTPTYVGFENPPVVGTLQGGPYGAANGFWKLFEYGVLCIEWEVPCKGTWAELVTQSRGFQESQGAGIVEAEKRARELAKRLGPALEGVYANWLHEDYLVLHLEDIGGAGNARLSAEEVIDQFGGQIAQLVRGEWAPLSARERDEVLSARMSCYESDLLVAGWAAAFVYEPRQPRW